MVGVWNYGKCVDKIKNSIKTYFIILVISGLLNIKIDGVQTVTNSF